MTDSDSSARPVTGASLARLLDRLEADLREASPAEMDLITQLAAQPMRADTLEALFRLCSLWLRAGDAGRAQAVAQGDGPELAASAAPGERDDIRMHLALASLWLAHERRDEAAALAALGQARQIAQEAGPRLAWRDGGGPIRANAGGYREWNVLSECTDWTLDTTLAVFDLRRALDIADPDLAQRHAATEAFHFASRAQALRQAGQTEPARQAAAQAVRALSGAAPPQTVDEDDWLRLADAVIEAAPDLYPALAQPITSLTASRSLPQRREIEIRLARLQARSRYAQGDLAGALALRETTHYMLDPYGNGEDDFFEHNVSWLIEAGHYDDAGQEVFFHAYYFANRDLDHRELLQPLIHERLADTTDRSVWWPLYVMRICAYGADLFEQAFGADISALPSRSALHARLFEPLKHPSSVAAALPKIFEIAHQLAGERSPGHPWIERLWILHERQQERIADAQLMQRLDALMAQGFTDGHTLRLAFLARIRTLSLPKALQLPMPAPSSAMDAYLFASGIDTGKTSSVEGEIKGIQAWIAECPERERPGLKASWANVRRSFYEQGIARMERFFEAGKGHRFDASPHQYSQMCNNLAIEYGYYANRYDDAVAIHNKGIQVSPFVEHYNGIFNALRNKFSDAQNLDSAAQKKLRERIIEAAENLWQYAAAHGHGCADPNDYIYMTVMHLYYLKRFDEIPLWLERLVQWQENENGDNPAQLQHESLYSRVMCLQYLVNAGNHQSTASALSQTLQSQVQASKNERIQLIFGNVLYGAGNFADAITFYQRHIELNPQSTPEQRNTAKNARKSMTECQAKIAQSQRSWWQFWK